MAQFTKTNGDFLPVLHLDTGAYTNAGLNAVAYAVAVQPQGPKLEYFTVTATGALTGAQVLTLVQTVQQLATIYIYQVNDDTNDFVGLALYPYGAWTAATIDTALTAAGIASTTTTDGAEFTAGA
jgi:hypothetical protein